MHPGNLAFTNSPLTAILPCSCAGARDATKPGTLFSEHLPAFVMACDAAGGVKRLVVLSSDWDTSARTPKHKAPWIYDHFLAPYILKKMNIEYRKFEDWVAALTGMTFGRAIAGDSPRVQRQLSSSIKLTVVRPYNYKNWDTDEVRAQVLTAQQPGLPACSYNTSRRALGKWMGTRSWDNAFIGSVIVDTPNPPGCC